jgi:tRNA pseudouridine38-40 synthase
MTMVTTAATGFDTDVRAVYALTLEYDGTAFSGWQRQPGRRTVEGVLLLAIAGATGEQALLTAAGRTDAGAHAHGQVVGCTLRKPWDPARLAAAINAHLPEDVVVVDAQMAPPTFHARFDAIARSYRYVVSPRRQRQAVARQYAWCVRGRLDTEAMRRAAQQLLGTHDFASFGRSPRPGGTTVRTVRSVDVRRVEAPEVGAAADAPPRAVVIIDVEADAFLYGMMRAIAGALVAVGTGHLADEDFRALVDEPAAGRPRIAVAPAHGLHQWQVTYS